MIFSDNTLRAYLAGAASSEVSASIETAVANDPKLEQRLISLDPFAAPIKTAFGDVPPAGRLEQFNIGNDIQPSGSAPLVRYAATALIGAAIGYGVFASQPGPSTTEPGWKDFVAAYQSLYVAETVKNILSTPEQISEQMIDAGSQIGLSLPGEQLALVPNLTLKRAQILGFQSKPLIQIAFEGPDGTPIALCIIRSEQGARPMGSEVLVGLASASWSTDTHSFLLIGGTDADEITETAQHLTEFF